MVGRAKDGKYQTEILGSTFPACELQISACFESFLFKKTIFRQNESPKVGPYWPSALQGRPFLVRKLLCFKFLWEGNYIVSRQLSNLQFASSNSCIGAAKLQNESDFCKCFDSLFFRIYLINFGFKRNDYRLLISDASEQHHNDSGIGTQQEITTTTYKPTETTTSSFEARQNAYKAKFTKCCNDKKIPCISGQCAIKRNLLLALNCFDIHSRYKYILILILVL